MKIDTGSIRERLDEMVRKDPGYVYERPLSGGCRYAQWNLPDCGVGRVLHSLGVPIETLNAMDDIFSSEIHQDTVLGVLSRAGFELDERAVTVLSRFQYGQDSGTPYGTIEY